MALPNVLKLAGSGTSEIIALHTSPTVTGNTAGVTTLLDEYQVPGGTLSHDGDSVEFEYMGQFELVTGVQVTVLWDGGTIFDSGVLTAAHKGFTIMGRVVRTGENTQKAISRIISGDSQDCLVYTATADLAGPVTLSIHGLGNAGSDVSTEMSVVNFRGISI